MKYCKNCEIKYDSEQTKCIFCNSELVELDKNPCESSFPPFKGYYPLREVVLRFIAFGLIAIITIISIINAYVLKDRFYYLFAIVSSIYIFIIAKCITNPRRSMNAKVLIITGWTLIQTIFTFRFFNWELDYIYFEFVFPGAIIIAIILQLIFFYVFKRRKKYDNLFFLLLTLLIGMIPMIAAAVNLIEESWLSAICMGISGLLLVWFILFERVLLIDELRRRFHI